MTLVYNFTIDGKRDATSIFCPNALYLLPDETLINVITGPVWCNRCRDFRPGEVIATESEVRSLLSRSLSGDLPEYHEFIFRNNVAEIERFRESLTRRLRWIAGRRSPPKCLACGGCDLKPIPCTADEPFVDDLGRTVSCSCAFGGSNHRLCLYDAEGNFLGEISRLCSQTDDLIDETHPYARILEKLAEERHPVRSEQ